jgi:hypothetical protein
VPVEVVYGCEGPQSAIEGQSMPYMVIPRNIFRIIKGDKAIIRNLPENCKGNYYQKKAYE